MNQFTHFDENGASRMVDVGEKAVTRRVAKASAVIKMQPETLRQIKDGETKKGNVLEVARLAGIMGAKKTSDLIPLCHQIPLESVTIDYSFPDDSTVAIQATACVDAKTGVEMEALMAASTTALTIYDMCKAVDRAMVIESICLQEKSGGRSGHFVRNKEK